MHGFLCRRMCAGCRCCGLLSALLEGAGTLTLTLNVSVVHKPKHVGPQQLFYMPLHRCVAPLHACHTVYGLGAGCTAAVGKPVAAGTNSQHNLAAS